MNPWQNQTQKTQSRSHSTEMGAGRTSQANGQKTVRASMICRLCFRRRCFWLFVTLTRSIEWATKELIQYYHQHVLNLDIHHELDDFIDHCRVALKRIDTGHHPQQPGHFSPKHAAGMRSCSYAIGPELDPSRPCPNLKRFSTMRFCLKPWSTQGCVGDFNLVIGAC